ncbi:hypothetical protein Rhopal_000192-T1 [Rhodotorula paludigena]|uniref:Large ribosomal subunit protein uL15/eL18 domain-containing protein n=1 Tax=Rhodotorula paludigena TaxID=86838 RepID=A0AAV5GDT3_9BASI|nr:hypothetical protein Rhopal_000192-T1 [Rhodotorula paludigena]
MSLTRALQRLSLAAHPRPPVLALARSSLASSSRAPAPAHAPQPGGSRAYATEAAHLGNLAPHPGSTKNRKRIGRGIGSGRGGTSGRGHKGQGARSGNGKPAAHFAGGQTPLTRAYPKRGFTNPNKENLVPLNLERLQHWIDRGLIDPSRPITMRELYETRCVHGVQDGVKLLGDGAEYLTSPNLHITVSKASQSAIDAVEKLGGTLIARYENRLTLRALIRPESFYLKGRPIPGKADPVSRRDLLYYSDMKHRGYLAIEAAADRSAREAVAEAQAGEEVQEAQQPVQA